MPFTNRVKKIIKTHFRASRNPAFDPLANRQRLKAEITSCAENGQVAIVYGGMDCDCSRWDNRVAIVTAATVIVERWIESYHEGAEGPQWTQIERPSEARKLEPSSRDLALEAFEDGHPQVVHV